MRLSQEIPQSIPETDENESSIHEDTKDTEEHTEQIGPVFVVVQTLTKGSVFVSITHKWICLILKIVS